MSRQRPLRAISGLNPIGVPDRDTCPSMLWEIRWEASRMPEQYLPAKEITVRYRTVMHWLEHQTPLSPAQRADICHKPPNTCGYRHEFLGGDRLSWPR
jgi:hypothetical protein